MGKREIRRWEVLASKYLIRRPWLTARVDSVRLPTGAVNDEYYVLEYPAWVNVTAITEAGKFVMVEQYRHGIGETCMELCAGVVDPTDKTPLEAAKRELLEETGYGGGEWSLLLKAAPNASAMNNFSYCFLAEGVRKISGQHLEPTEDIAVRLLSECSVLELLGSGGLKQALMIAPLYKYFYGKCAGNPRRDGKSPAEPET